MKQKIKFNQELILSTLNCRNQNLAKIYGGVSLA